MCNISSKCFSIFNDKPPGSWASHITTDFLTCYPCSYHSSMGLRTNMLRCQRGLCANVPACQRASVLKACQHLIFTCQRANKRDNVSTWRANFSSWLANVSKDEPIFRSFLLCFIIIKNSTLYLISWLYILYAYVYIKTVLNFISIFHVILKKSEWNFLIVIIIFLFCSSVRDENVKRPGFYTLQVTRIFSNFPQLKQQNKEYK